MLYKTLEKFVDEMHTVLRSNMTTIDKLVKGPVGRKFKCTMNVLYSDQGTEY